MNSKLKHFSFIPGFFVLLAPHIIWAQIDSIPQDITFQYKLETGKIMCYTSRGKLEYSKGMIYSEEHLNIWVLEQNPDSSWHLLLHNTAMETKTEGQEKPEVLSEECRWAFCDFDPRGIYSRSYAMDRVALFDLFLPNLLPPLPDDFSEESIVWKSTDRMYGESVSYTAQKPDPKERSWIIEATHLTPLDEIYMMNQKADIYMDHIEGIPIYERRESIRGYGNYAGKSSATVILDSIVDQNELFKIRYIRELELLLSADSAYEYILNEAAENPSKLALSRSSAEYLLQQTNTRIIIPEIKEQLEKTVSALPEDFKDLIERTNRHSKLVNKPAPGWKVEDFSGEKHSLDDFLGNVILIDFWYRGCPWCIRALSSIEQVAKHFEGKAAVILGMNTDRNREDAIFVVQKKEPVFINLSGRSLIKKYGITNYPTFIIIDRKGLVHSIHIGYETDLAQKLIEIIESLL
jgi:thiol-disulfide isomerase/thioredoxin